MSFNRGLIQNDKYFTQFGQLRRMGRTKYGDPTETSAATVPLLVYQEDQREVQTTPAVSQKTRHFATISSTFAVSEGDHLTQITDRLGITVLPPDINESQVKFTVVEDGIRFGNPERCSQSGKENRAKRLPMAPP